MKKLIIIGAGGMGLLVADAAQKNGYEDIVFLDDGDRTDCMGYPVVGKTKDMTKYAGEDFFVSIGNAKVREKVCKEIMDAGLNLVNVIHPSAIISSGVTLGKGILLAAGSIVNPCATIGNGVFVCTTASVDHSNVVGDYCLLAVDAHLAGDVVLGKRTWIGIGAVVSHSITICDDCMIGAGATVVKNITESGTYVGTPAKKLIK